MNHRAHLHSACLPKDMLGGDYLVFDRLSLQESVNDLYTLSLIVKAKDTQGRAAHGIEGLEGYVSYEAYENSRTDNQSHQSVAAYLDLSTLIGTPLGISLDFNNPIPLDNRTLTGAFIRHGIITQASQLTTHNRHATYQLTLRPWLYLLTQTNNYRIYQHQSVIDIISDILSHYPYAYEFYLSHNYPALDYQTQYDESDYAFINRLMSEHGLSFYFEHKADTHTLIISDDNRHLKRHANPFYDNLTLYPPNQRLPEFGEYLEHFHPTQTLTPAQSLMADYQFKQPDAPLISHDVIGSTNTSTSSSANTSNQHSHHQALIYHLQCYEWQQGRRAHADALDSLNQAQIHHYQSQSFSAHGQGQLKGLMVGHLFTLNGHPHPKMNEDWLILSLSLNLYAIDAGNNAHQYYTADTHFRAQPAAHRLMPAKPTPKPMARSQTATVVAPDNEEIYTDQYGRIKVKFHWDKPSLNQRHILDNRPSSSKADSHAHINTCWLRVATMWAGEHYGHIQLPRAGMEVIIDFFGGNPDMPYISGCLTNPNQLPPYTLPDERVLSGIKSKEYQGTGVNQLIMDDTTGKLQTHLKSDHLHSELNLGHIRRLTTPQGRGEYRGEGFELRTDGHGVIRSDKGIIITTHGRQAAGGHVKEIGQTNAQLQSATSTHQALMQSSIQAQCETRSLDSTLMPTLDTLNASMTGESTTHEDEQITYPELSCPHLALSSLAGIAMTAKQNIHITTQDNLAITASKDLSLATTSKYNLNVQNGINIFSQTGGIKHYSAKDDIELQAQDGQIKHIAKDTIHITSTENGIHIISPTQITLNAAGSELKINEHGIFITTPKTFRVKSEQKVFEGGGIVLTELPALPKSGLFSRRFDFGQIFDSENLVRGVRYKLINHTNSTSYVGTLDAQGRTIRVFGNSQDEIEVVIIGHDNSNELIMHELQGNVGLSGLEEIACCACESESLNLDLESGDLGIEDDLEEDYNDFGN